MAEKNLAEYIPALRYTARDSQSWTTSGNTHTVTDGNVVSSSIIVLMWTANPGTTYYITPASGSFVITAADVIESGTTFKYLIF